MLIRTTLLGVIGIAAGLVDPGSSASSAGIEMRRGSIVLYGSASTTERPGSMVRARVLAAAPETTQIRHERVPPGSARYELLVSRRLRRIRAAALQVARELECDCVVFKRDVRDARGLKLVDVTSRILEVMPRIEIDREDDQNVQNVPGTF